MFHHRTISVPATNPNVKYPEPDGDVPWPPDAWVATVRLSLSLSPSAPCSLCSLRSHHPHRAPDGRGADRAGLNAEHLSCAGPLAPEVEDRARPDGGPQETETETETETVGDRARCPRTEVGMGRLF